MSDMRIVQCFGIKKRPRKPEKKCRKRFLWTARTGGKHQFGRKGTQACPNCGTLPDFSHPYNRYLNQEITGEEAEAAMPDYNEKCRKIQEEK
jgi:hypothetical protein